MPFQFKNTELPDVILINPVVFGDERGFFMESYKESEFSNHGIKDYFVQDNHSKSQKNVLRGLHFQLPPFGQAKLVRCIVGEIFDVAVDIRKNSKTFGQWTGHVLSENNKHMLYIPSGFAHGYFTISEIAEVLYKTTAEYAPEYDRGIIWNDPKINIAWPSFEVLLSEKDQKHPPLDEADIFP
jgi:dTDP-4-dehydrorhamnose 3,5-epimerase